MVRVEDPILAILGYPVQFTVCLIGLSINDNNRLTEKRPGSPGLVL